MARPSNESKRVPHHSRDGDAVQGRKGTRPRMGAAPGAAAPKRDDPGQSKRFIDVARQIGADKDDSRADELMGKLAKQPPGPRKGAPSRK